LARDRKINPPFRADIVGSFLRPQRLISAREKMGLTGGSAAVTKVLSDKDAAELKRIEDEAIRDVVKFEEDCGLKVVTDGEMRRGSWAYDLINRIVGIELKQQTGDAATGFTFTSGNRPPIAHAEGKLGRPEGGIVLKDYLYTKTLTDRTVKVTMPTPTLAYVRGGRAAVSKEVYPDIEEFFQDLMKVYQDEISDLAANGCTYVQIDNTDSALLCDPKFQEASRRNGMEPQDQLSLHGRLISGAVSKRPDNVTVSMHLCRGNGQGAWLAEGGYEYIAEKLFNEFDVDAFFLEYDSERAGDFQPLRFVPKDKIVVLGLVTTKTPENDDRDTLLRRIEDAAKYVPIDNLCLSPQCGFSSGARGNPITVEDTRRKLDLVQDVAREVWGDR
jgi:5-methyltetrahydropteroyltriglutamate--homocysteine methyltransferase